MKWILILIVAFSLFSPLPARAENRCLRQGGGECTPGQSVPECSPTQSGGGCTARDRRHVWRQDAEEWREGANQQPLPPYQGEIGRSRQRPR